MKMQKSREASPLGRSMGPTSAQRASDVAAQPLPAIYSTRGLRRCGCGRLAMPGEGTCYSHQ